MKLLSTIVACCLTAMSLVNAAAIPTPPPDLGIPGHGPHGVGPVLPPAAQGTDLPPERRAPHVTPIHLTPFAIPKGCDDMYHGKCRTHDFEPPYAQLIATRPRLDASLTGAIPTQAAQATDLPLSRSYPGTLPTQARHITDLPSDGFYALPKTFSTQAIRVPSLSAQATKVTDPLPSANLPRAIPYQATKLEKIACDEFLSPDQVFPLPSQAPTQTIDSLPPLSSDLLNERGADSFPTPTLPSEALRLLPVCHLGKGCATPVPSNGLQPRKIPTEANYVAPPASEDAGSRFGILSVDMDSKVGAAQDAEQKHKSSTATIRPKFRCTEGWCD